MATQRICDACGVVLEGGPKWELREMLPVSNTASRPITTYDLCSEQCLVTMLERIAGLGVVVLSTPREPA